jgi:type I restriction enzyme M protein
MQDIMRQDTGVDGDAQRISQMVWMIFLKIFDDREQEYELLDDNYRSPIPKRLRWRTWAANPEGVTGEELVDFINNDLFKTLKNLSFSPEGDPRGFIVKEVFEDAYNYMKSGTLIRQVVNKINGIDFNVASERHLFGDIYEQILKDLQSAGNAGEYYTPRAVTQFMTDMVNPRLGERFSTPPAAPAGFWSAPSKTSAKARSNPSRITPSCRGAFSVSRKNPCRTCSPSPTCCCTASMCPRT